MAFTKEEIGQWDGLVKSFIENRRPPEEIREKLDVGYSIQDQNIEIFEIRPQWKNQEVKNEIPVAKTTWIRNQKAWKIYWKRADLKWYGYDPMPEVDTLEEFLRIVDEDKHSCFWG